MSKFKNKKALALAISAAMAGVGIVGVAAACAPTKQKTKPTKRKEGSSSSLGNTNPGTSSGSGNSGLGTENSGESGSAGTTNTNPGTSSGSGNSGSSSSSGSGSVGTEEPKQSTPPTQDSGKTNQTSPTETNKPSDSGSANPETGSGSGNSGSNSSSGTESGSTASQTPGSSGSNITNSSGTDSNPQSKPNTGSTQGSTSADSLTNQEINKKKDLENKKKNSIATIDKLNNLSEQEKKSFKERIQAIVEPSNEHQIELAVKDAQSQDKKNLEIKNKLTVLKFEKVNGYLRLTLNTSNETYDKIKNQSLTLEFQNDKNLVTKDNTGTWEGSKKETLYNIKHKDEKGITTFHIETLSPYRNFGSGKIKVINIFASIDGKQINILNQATKEIDLG